MGASVTAIVDLVNHAAMIPGFSRIRRLRRGPTLPPELRDAFDELSAAAASRAARTLPPRVFVAAAPGSGTNGRRLVAYLIDGLIVIPVAILGPVLFFALPDRAAGGATFLLSLVPIGYLTAMHARTGQTVGKRAAGLRVQRVEAALPPSLPAAFLRALLSAGTGLALLDAGLLVGGSPAPDAVRAPLAGALLVASQLWTLVDCSVAFSDPRRRPLHDRLAGTVVVRVTLPPSAAGPLSGPGVRG